LRFWPLISSGGFAFKVFHVKQSIEVLRSGAGELGIRLEPPDLERLAAHLEMLAKWNAKLNLVGPGTPASWAVRHTLDSLAIAPWVKGGARVVDVGSGAGFPGVPLALICPTTQFTLLEPRANRAAFLVNVVAKLALKNAVVEEARAEAQTEQFDLVIGRAVTQPEQWAQLAARLCGSGGAFVVFAQAEPPRVLGTGCRERVRAYSVSGSVTRWVAIYVPRGTES
jgi:16S rRNA (guanine527-N7)-methyltransferase